MGLPGSGTYEIVNIATGLYFDLSESDVVPGNNIIGYPGHGVANQRWVFEREGSIFILRSLLSGEAQVATTGHVAGGQVVIKHERERFEIVEVETGQYRMKIPDQNLVFRLASSTPREKVTLDPVGRGNDVWRFDGIQAR